MAKTFRDPLSKLLYAQRQVQLYFKHIGPIVCSLRFVPDEAQEITLHALPDGQCLYRPDFIDAVPFNQLASLEAHIAFHTALQEYERANFCGAEPWKFRFAMESHLHAVLEHAGMPEIFGTSEFRHHEWDNMAPETIAKQIADAPEGTDPVAAAIMACPARLPLNIGRKKRELDPLTGLPSMAASVMSAALVQSQAMAKGIGNGSFGAKILISKVFQPQVKWEDQLRFAMAEVMGRQGRTFKRPHSRSAGISIAAGRPFTPRPSANKGLDAVWIVFDLSGSVVGDPGLVEAYISELWKILKICRRPCRVIFHDTKILDDFRTKDIREVKEKLYGAGGTDFRPVYDLIAQSKEPVPMVVWLTDMFGAHGSRPRPPFLWCTGQRHGLIPWGRHVKIKPKISSPDDNDDDILNIF